MSDTQIPYPALRQEAEKPFDYEDRIRKLKLVLEYNEGELERAKASIENTQKILEGIEELLNSRVGYNYGDNDE